MMFRPGQFLSHLVLLISYFANSALAQTYTSATECGSRANLEHYGLYDATRLSRANDSMRWCPYWAVECAYVYQHCPDVVTCSFTNYDARLPSTYDPSVYGNARSFLSCRRCDVRVDPVSVFPSDVRVPQVLSSTPTSDGNDPTSSPSSTQGRPGDVTAERRAIYAITFTLTSLIFVGGLIGSALSAKRAMSSGTPGIGHQSPISPGFSPGAVIIPPAPPSAGRSFKALGLALTFVSPLTLLLHFQSISTSGFLSISYAPIYQYFTLNFSWANLIIPLQFFRNAARQLDAIRPCERAAQSDTAADQEAMGLGFVAQRYTGDRGNIGTLAFLSAIAVVVIVLLLSVLVSLVLHILRKITKAKRIETFAQAFPSIASNFILRVFVWLLGSISTFAFYQFSQPCSSRSLLALSAFEFTLLFGTLVIISVLIVRTVRREGNPDVLFRSESGDDTMYSRRWSSLYDNLKPMFYYWFILDNLAVVVRSAIVSFVQGAGFRQLGALLSFDFVIVAALIFIRPYKSTAQNIYQSFSAGKRLIMTSMLYVYWQGFNVKPEMKRAVGMAQMTIESIHAAVLIVILLIVGVTAISRLRSRRDEKNSMTKPFMQSEIDESKFEPTGSPMGYRSS